MADSMPWIVGVDRCDVGGGGLLDGDIARSRHPGVCLPDQAQSRLGAGVALDDLGSVVGRAVFHDDDLDPLERLGADGAQGLEDGGGGVVGRHDDADGGRGNGHGVRFSRRASSSDP